MVAKYSFSSHAATPHAALRRRSRPLLYTTAPAPDPTEVLVAAGQHLADKERVPPRSRAQQAAFPAVGRSSFHVPSCPETGPGMNRRAFAMAAPSGAGATGEYRARP